MLTAPCPADVSGVWATLRPAGLTLIAGTAVVAVTAAVAVELLVAAMLEVVAALLEVVAALIAEADDELAAACSIAGRAAV